MRAGQSSKSLTIAAPRDITGRWLAPRLAAIAAADPELRFTLIAAEQALDFTEANLDCAIRWGDGFDDLESVAVGESGLVEIAPPSGDGHATVCWQGGRNADDRASIFTVADAGLAIDAVAGGVGRARVPALLAAGDIASGRVREVARHDGAHRYWIVAPTPQWRQKKVRALVEALTRP
jgi:LysR family glycine cleavage system transcriptional activator